MVILNYVLILMWVSLSRVFGGKLLTLKGNKKVEYTHISQETYLFIHDHELIGNYEEVNATSEAACRWIQITSSRIVASVGRRPDGELNCRISDWSSSFSFKPQNGSSIFYEVKGSKEFFPASNGIFYFIDYSTKTNFSNLSSWCNFSDTATIPLAKSGQEHAILKKIAQTTENKSVFIGVWYTDQSQTPKENFQWVDGKDHPPPPQNKVENLKGSTNGPVSFTDQGTFRIEVETQTLTPVCAHDPFGYDLAKNSVTA